LNISIENRQGKRYTKVTDNRRGNPTDAATLAHNKKKCEIACETLRA
jgi:hypothetical protein